MDSMTEMQTDAKSNVLLQEMKSRVESLWQSLIYAKSPDEKERLRSEYQRALKTYQQQSLIVRAEPPVSTDLIRELRAPNAACPSPFDYRDYRDFLLAWLKYQKQTQQNVLEEFTRKTELSVDHILRVLKRSRRLPLAAHRKVLGCLGLPATETAFLDALYHLSESDSKEVRIAAIRRMMSFAEFQRKSPAETEAWRYLSHWFYVAIREMATLPDFRADAAWIQKRLRYDVPLADIRKALAFLESSGFLEIRENGRVESKLKFVECAGGIYRLALGQFHREMLEKAGLAIETIPSEKRLLLGHTMALPKERQDAVFEILREAMTKITALQAGERSTDDVFHVEIAAFPLTDLAPGTERST